jgi:hypothetical protein
MTGEPERCSGFARLGLMRKCCGKGTDPLLGIGPVVILEIRLQPDYIPSDDRDDGADPFVAI